MNKANHKEEVVINRMYMSYVELMGKLRIGIPSNSKTKQGWVEMPTKAELVGSMEKITTNEIKKMGSALAKLQKEVNAARRQ